VRTATQIFAPIVLGLTSIVPASAQEALLDKPADLSVAETRKQEKISMYATASKEPELKEAPELYNPLAALILLGTAVCGTGLAGKKWGMTRLHTSPEFRKKLEKDILSLPASGEGGLQDFLTSFLEEFMGTYFRSTMQEDASKILDKLDNASDTDFSLSRAKEMEPLLEAFAGSDLEKIREYFGGSSETRSFVRNLVQLGIHPLNQKLREYLDKYYLCEVSEIKT